MADPVEHRHAHIRGQPQVAPRNPAQSNSRKEIAGRAWGHVLGLHVTGYKSPARHGLVPSLMHEGWHC